MSYVLVIGSHILPARDVALPVVRSDRHFADGLGPDGYKTRMTDLPLPEGMVLLESGTRGETRDEYNARVDHEVETGIVLDRLADRDVFDDLPVSEFNDAIREYYKDRFIHLDNLALPEMEHSVAIDLDDESLAALSGLFGREVTMANVREMERSPFYREAREEMRIYNLAAEDRKIADIGPIFLPDDRHNGAPRSIRETMRRQRPGKHKRNKGRGR